MTWEDTLKIIISALGAVGGAGVIIIGLSSWLGKIWANRILESDRAKYANELEALKHSNEAALNSLALANSAYFESQKGFTERRLKAINTIWQEIIALRDEKPSAIVLLDILVEPEYPEFSANPKFAFAEEQTKLENIQLLNRNDVDKVLPYLDDRSYQLYWAYRALIGRLCFYINKFYSNKIPDYGWREDRGINAILRATFSTDEVDLFHSKKWAVLETFQYIEFQLSRHLKQLSSGKEIAHESLEDSMKFNKALLDIKSNMPRAES